MINVNKEIVKIAKTIGPVLPVDSVNKKPMHKGWKDSATLDPEGEGMQFPLGVGIKTGITGERNLIVIDTDNEAAEQFLRENLTTNELDTYTVKTRRGKHYYYFANAEDDFRNKTKMVMKGLDVRANGGFIISPPSQGYSVLHDRPIAPLPVYLKGLIGLHERKCHGMSPMSISEFQISNSSILWEFLREIDPSLNRNDWLKVLSIAKHYYDDSSEITMYWSALSKDKFPGVQEFEDTWDSLNNVQATPASLIYLAKQHQWARGILPIIPYDKLDDARELALQLFRDCKTLLERRNRLTEAEEDVLLIASEVLTFSLFSDEKERIAVPLPTGFGKSTLIRSLIVLLKKENINKKLLICVARHAEILESIEELKSMGLDDNTVGVFMSREYKSDWDTTVEALDEKQAVYISHNRVYNVKDYQRFSHLSTANGEERLVLWDESAQTTKGVWVSADDIEEQVLGLIRRMDRVKLERTADEEELYKWLVDLNRKLFEEEYGEMWIPAIGLPQGFKIRIGSDLGKLLDNSGCFVAMSKINNSDTMFIWIQVKIPDEMSCIIFDASSVTRELIQYDKSIRHLNADIVRDYSRCQLDCVNIKSSKGHLNNRDNADIQIQILKEWMRKKGISGNELLVVTQIPRYVHKGGKDINVDLPGRIRKEIPGVNVITWGSERGVNQYQNLKYTANIGMKWRDRRDLKAEIQAQKRDLDALVTYPEIDNVQNSEFLSEVQQWIPRTNMRISVDGRSKDTRILFIHSNASQLAEELSRDIFPGLDVKLYDTQIVSFEQERERIVEKIVQYLSDISQGVVSTVKLKCEMNLTGISKDRWQTIASRVEESLMFHWRRQGRSWVRIAA